VEDVAEAWYGGGDEGSAARAQGGCECGDLGRGCRGDVAPGRSGDGARVIHRDGCSSGSGEWKEGMVGGWL
jgi:hypothetical protein